MNSQTLTAISDAQSDIYINNVYVDEIYNQEHTHTKGQLLYAEGGIIHIFAAGKHWYLPARFYMWIPAGLPHYLESSSAHLRLYNYYFAVNKNDPDFYKEPNVYLVNDLLREMFLFTKDWNGPINKKDHVKYSFVNAIKAILPQISASMPEFAVQHPYPKDKRLHEIARYLNKNIDTALSLEQVAEKFGFSSRTLSRLFKENVGYSYVRFLRALRISKALELMTENKYNINEIGLMVGYNTISAFSEIFKRVTGIRPSDYMAKITKYKNTDLKKA